MKKYLVILILFASCRVTDYRIAQEVASEYNGGGTIGIYRTDVNYSKIHNYKKYFEIQLNSPNLLKQFDTVSLQRSVAYRLFIKLSKNERKEYQAIRVIFKDNILTQLDTTNFFTMSYLNSIKNSELLTREYMKALINNDYEYLKKAFDYDEFGYSALEVDSINTSLLKITKGKFSESRLYNWAIVEDNGKKYRLLVFFADAENNYNTKFQFALHDSLKNGKNIVSIKY